MYSSGASLIMYDTAYVLQRTTYTTIHERGSLKNAFSLYHDTAFVLQRACPKYLIAYLLHSAFHILVGCVGGGEQAAATRASSSTPHPSSSTSAAPSSCRILATAGSKSTAPIAPFSRGPALLLLRLRRLLPPLHAAPLPMHPCTAPLIHPATARHRLSLMVGLVLHISFIGIRTLWPTCRLICAAAPARDLVRAFVISCTMHAAWDPRASSPDSLTGRSA